MKIEHLTAAESPPEERDPRPDRILAIAAGDRIFPLYCEGQGVAYAAENNSLEDEFDEYPKEVGCLVWEGRFAKVSSGTWEDPTPEYALVGDWRMATAEEITAYIDGEFVWEVWRPACESALTHEQEVIESLRQRLEAMEQHLAQVTQERDELRAHIKAL